VPEPANKFIEAAENSNGNPSSQRQQLYLQMSQYAADTVRIDEFERIKDKHYQPVRVNRTPLKSLFRDSRLSANAIASWNRGGLYVTALKVSNNSSSELPVDYQAVKGDWLASSVERNVLAAHGEPLDNTYLYLVSVMPFDDVINAVR
jgi:general secretion pathway protein D